MRHHWSAKKKSCQPSCDRSFVRSIPVSQGFRSGRGSSRSVKHGNVVQAGGGRGLRVNWSSKATWSLSALPRLLNESRLSDGGVPRSSESPRGREGRPPTAQSREHAGLEPRRPCFAPSPVTRPPPGLGHPLPLSMVGGDCGKQHRSRCAEHPAQADIR